MDEVTVMKSELRLKNWTALIEECQTSGLTVKAWCEQHNISDKTYYYWLRKVRKQTMEQTGLTNRAGSTPVLNVNDIIKVPTFDGENSPPFRYTGSGEISLLKEGIYYAGGSNTLATLGQTLKTTIKTLHEQGHAKAHIARLLGIDRKTVRKVLNNYDAGVPPEQRKAYPSQFDPYSDYIFSKLDKGLSMARIHQDLQREFGMEAACSSLRDYVRKKRPKTPKAYMVLQSPPGSEAQVDFGYIGTLLVCGKRRKAWVFIMTLSCSRYMYTCITLDQSVKTFIRAHGNAFAFFRGVPKTVKIDNLKAAILEADFYEPLTQRTYAAFAKHYGFLPDPCRVYTPTDKGKVEANVKYVKDNCFKGREFDDLAQAEAFLHTWLTQTANKRTHGTTKKVPEEIFQTVEVETLMPLPKEPFIFSKTASAQVNTACHVSYQSNYYSVPYEYISFEVDLIETNHLLRIYYQGKEIALHQLAGNSKGEHITDKNHYPSSKNITIEEILSNLRGKMEAIGPGAMHFFEQYQRDPNRAAHARGIQGVLSLQKRYDPDTIDQACMRACHYGNITYRCVKTICEKGLEQLPLEDVSFFTQPTEQVLPARPLSAYQNLLELGVIGHE